MQNFSGGVPGTGSAESWSANCDFQSRAGSHQSWDRPLPTQAPLPSQPWTPASPSSHSPPCNRFSPNLNTSSCLQLPILTCFKYSPTDVTANYLPPKAATPPDSPTAVTNPFPMTDYQRYHCYIMGSYEVTEDIIIYLDLENVCSLCSQKANQNVYRDPCVWMCADTRMQAA